MLADTPLPRGSGANLAVVGTLSEGFRRIVAAPPHLVGYVRWDARSNHSSLLDNHVQQLTDRTVQEVCHNREVALRLAEIGKFACLSRHCQTEFA
jgi:hypothetical protein